jgi:hypothetical protein
MILKRGDKGENVRLWQRFLLGRGFAVVDDADFGAKTEHATLLFQRDVQIDDDGKVGPATIAAAVGKGFAGFPTSASPTPSPKPKRSPTWRLAESLKTLRRQVNEMFPDRDKASDGSIGDTAHQATKSEHNPDEFNVVRAIDIDADLSDTVKVGVLRDALLAAKDDRLHYLISDGKIYSSYPAQAKPAWAPRPYTGKNAHRHHLHISVAPDDWTKYDDASEWELNLPAA